MKTAGFTLYAILATCIAFAIAATFAFLQNTVETDVIKANQGKITSDQVSDTKPGSLGNALQAVSSAFLSSASSSENISSGKIRLSDTEKRYRRQLSELLSPLHKLKLSDEDKTAFTNALKALKQNNLAEARRNGDKISLPAASKFISWSILRSGYGRPEDYREFLNENPLWPGRALLQRRLEQSLFIDGGSVNNILSQFQDTPPATDAGYAAIASAYLALGKHDIAKRYAGKAWCGGGIAARREKYFLTRFNNLLDNKDHTCRLNRLLVDNLRWRSSRRTRAHAVRRVIKLLDEKDRKKATARLAAFLRQKVATKWMNAVPASRRKDDWGYAFQRIKHLRLAKKHNAAWRLLSKVPTQSDKLINIDAWWEERPANSLNPIRLRKYKLAASFVDNIRPEGANAAIEQAFFAGWLALRKRAKPKSAITHFKRLLSLVDGPLSTSKAHYWLGQSYAALEQQQNAAKHYEASAKFPDTFHGLLAAQTLNPENRNLDLPYPTLPTNEDVRKFMNLDAVQAVIIAHRLELPRSQILSFFRALSRRLENEAQVAMLAQLAVLMGDGQLEVRTGKAGVARGFNLYIFSYPLNYLPAHKPLRTPPEPAVVLAVARQESEFNTRAVSGAGARGMLQIMPATARDICRQYKIKCELKKLLDKPSYNARLATAYLADRTEEFNGSYILTFTGYNAGPGRTRQWLRKLGDPRRAEVRPLDWIYRIPFEETRIYAQKVLSNIQVYRARLGQKKPHRLIADMHRGRSE